LIQLQPHNQQPYMTFLNDSPEKVLKAAFAVLETRRPLNMDDVIDSLIAVAVATGDLEITAHDQIAIRYGMNERIFLCFKNCTSLFRALLARIYIRCAEASGSSVSGNLYGFESYVSLSYSNAKAVRLFIKTSNAQTYPSLIIKPEVDLPSSS
jgi:hypothetical protein